MDKIVVFIFVVLVSTNTFCQPKPTAKYIEYAREIFYREIFPKLKYDSSFVRYYDSKITVDIYPHYTVSPGAVNFKKEDDLLKFIVLSEALSVKVSVGNDKSKMCYLDVWKLPSYMWNDTGDYVSNKNIDWTYSFWRSHWINPEPKMNCSNTITITAICDFYDNNGVLKTIYWKPPFGEISIKQYEATPQGVYKIKDAALHSAFHLKMISEQEFNARRDSIWFEWAKMENTPSSR